MFIFIPVISLSTGMHSFTTGYEMFGKGLGTTDQFFALAGIGLNLHLSWWAYYNAIKHLGSTTATTINVTYIIWTPILSMVIYQMIGGVVFIPEWTYWTFSLFIILGTYFVVTEKSNNHKKIYNKIFGKQQNKNK